MKEFTTGTLRKIFGSGKCILLSAFFCLLHLFPQQINAQTVLVKDINVGNPGSYPFNFTNYGSMLYFHAKDTINGFEVWSVDVNDTVKLEKEVFNGIEDGFPFQFTPFGGNLIFSASDSIHGHELRSFNGTSVQLLADINPDTSNSWPANFIEYSGALYFSARDSAHGTELWKYDGSVVSRISDINPDTLNSFPSNFTVFNGNLIFAATDSSKGRELWQYNGSVVSRISDINTGAGSSNPVGMYEYNSTLLFNADNGSQGSELFSYNGSTVSLVQDIFTGAPSSFPHYFTEFNGKLYFTAIDGANGSEIWSYDGLQTQLVVDIYSGMNSSYPGDLTLFNNQLYFSANDGVNGYELMYLDTLDSVHVATNIGPGAADAYPINLTEFNGALYFQAQSPDLGFELWKFTPCNPGNKPILNFDSISVCVDSNFSIVVQNKDSLRNSTHWAIYKDSIGDTPLDSNASGVFQLSTGVNSIYFLRAEGCETAGGYDSVFVKAMPASVDTLQLNICSGDTLIFDGNPITLGGWYNFNYSSAIGCDSTIRLFVNEWPSYNDTISDTICNGDSLEFNSNFLNTSGTYNASFYSVNGCDSTVLLDLTVLPEIIDSVFTTFCEGSSITLGNITINSSGVYANTFQSAGGCDSTVVLNATMIPQKRDSMQVTICSGQSYLFGGQLLNTQGLYRDTLQSSTNCDSIVTLHLIVDQTTSSNTYAAICQGSSYSFYGINYSSSGTYHDTIPAAVGCDTIHTLHLNVHSIILDTIHLTKCTNDTLFYGSQNYSNAGVYTNTFSSQFGCDSIVTLIVTDLPIYSDTIYDTICNGSSIVFGSQVITNSGIYLENFSSTNSCDSSVVLNLTVLPTYLDTMVAYTCAGTPFIINNQSLFTTGVYNINFQSAAGCDSIVSVNLVVRPTYYDTLNVSICQGDTFSFASQLITTPGFYTQTYTSQYSCDSVITAAVTVNSVDTDTVFVNICQGSTYSFGNQQIFNSGLYIKTFQSTLGCDSVVYLYLMSRPVYSDTVSLDICEGDSVLFGSQWLTATGSYTHVFNSRYNCDSTVVMQLNVNPVYASFNTVTICQGEHMRIGTKIYTTPGTYSQTFSTSDGCDSVVTVQLIVNPVYEDSVYHVICAGDSTYFGGVYFKTSGVNSHVFQSVDGCDSTVTLFLLVNPVYNTTMYDTICQGEIFQFGNLQLSTSGAYSYVFQSKENCDSTVTLNLHVKPVYSSSINAAICQGDTFSLGNQLLTATGSYTEVFQANNGCDSVVTANLTVHPVYAMNAFDTLCIGDTIFFGSQVIINSGNYTETFNSSFGCDSLVNLSVTAYPSYYNVRNVSICADDSLVIGGNSYNTSGIYSHTFQSINGCDSTEEIHLTVNLTYNHTDSIAICNGDFYQFGPLRISSAGNYTHVFQSNLGCDSLVDLNVIVHPTYFNFDTAEICQNDTLVFGSQKLFAQGSYTESFNSQFGCDSTVMMTLIVHPVYSDSIEIDICSGDSLKLGPNYYTLKGIYTIINQSRFGCDSITRLKLNVLPEFTKTRNVNICGGSVFKFGSQILSEAGSYFELFQTINGCDSAVSLNLNVVKFDTTVQVKGNELIANQDNASYQWYKIDNVKIPIAGATEQSITVASNGVYTVRITENLCSAYSEEVEIKTVGVNKLDNYNFELFPNPNNGTFKIAFEPMGQYDFVSIQITTLTGVTVMSEIREGQPSILIEENELPMGVYLLQLGVGDQTFIKRIVIN